MRSLFLSLLLLACPHLQAEEEEIYVQLASEIELIPIFVSSVDSEESKLPQGYPEQIRQVLLFDLNHNGMTRVLEPKEVASFPRLQTKTAKTALPSRLIFLNLRKKDSSTLPSSS